MRYEANVPVSVSINEAVELTKKYASAEDAGFVNGVLGSVARANEDLTAQKEENAVSSDENVQKENEAEICR